MKPLLILLTFLPLLTFSQKPRARDLGIPFEGTPGKNNTITDVPGVEVGYTTLISGQGKMLLAKVPFEPALQLYSLAVKPTIPSTQTGTASTATAR